MVDWGTILSVVIGGTVTLLGTIVANCLQYRSEERRSRKERAKERFEEVRHYLTVCLEFVDLVSIPSALGPDQFGESQLREWRELIRDHFDTWKSLPVSGSARVLFVQDEEVLQWLKRVDVLRALFWINYQSLAQTAQMKRLGKECEELQQLAAKIGARLDKLLDTM
jgi:hypothetical protein